MTRMTACSPDPLNETDERFMAMALSIGYRNLGRTWPNPSVGAVLVASLPDGPQIVSQGATAKGGRPHAERIALNAAGALAKEATLYVTLEPCAHKGRTPPCSDAIIAAGVRRVVAALLDPDKRVSGLGFQLLRNAGVKVVTGILEAQAAHLHRGHLMRIRKQRPFITAKIARTRDGFAGSGTSERLIITTEAANKRTHMIRSKADAILIGVSTANADNPGLDVRLPGMGERSPVRVIFDSALRIDPHLNLIKLARVLPIWIVTADNLAHDKAQWLLDQGVHILHAPCGADGRLELHSALHQLYERGLSTVLCEGGPTLAQALSEQDLTDEFVVVTSPDRYEKSGLLALSPVMEEILEHRFRLLRTEAAGRDEFAFYEKVK